MNLDNLTEAQRRWVEWGLKQMEEAVTYGICRKCDCAICIGLRIGFKMGRRDAGTT